MLKIEKLGLDYAGHLAPYPFLMTIIFYINIYRLIEIKIVQFD